MSYSDYQSLKELTKELEITYQVTDLFPHIQEVSPSAFLLHSLDVAKSRRLGCRFLATQHNRILLGWLSPAQPTKLNIKRLQNERRICFF